MVQRDTRVPPKRSDNTLSAATWAACGIAAIGFAAAITMEAQTTVTAKIIWVTAGFGIVMILVAFAIWWRRFPESQKDDF